MPAPVEMPFLQGSPLGPTGCSLAVLHPEVLGCESHRVFCGEKTKQTNKIKDTCCNLQGSGMMKMMPKCFTAWVCNASYCDCPKYAWGSDVGSSCILSLYQSLML